MRDGAKVSANFTVAGPAVLDSWPEVDNPDTTIDDAGTTVTDITVQGVAVSPAFDPDVFTYTANVVDPATVVKSDFEVVGPDAGDVRITKNGLVFTIEVASAPGDPVYTVTVS